MKAADGALLEYERLVHAGLFKTGSPCKVSSLKNTFYKDLEKAKQALYADGARAAGFRAIRTACGR